MESKGKYVRHCDLFIVFTPTYQHRNLAVAVFGHNALFHGAGFVNTSIEDGKIVIDCHGESVSLGKGVRRDDKVRILDAMGVDNEKQGVIVAKYVRERYSVVIFTESLEFSKFTSDDDNSSAGYLRLSPQENGKIKVDCFDGEQKFAAGVKSDDYKYVAAALGITDSYTA